MCEFWYDYVKPNYGKKQQYIEWIQVALEFTYYIETRDIYEDIAKDFQTVLYPSNYELERPLPEGNIKKLSD